MIVCGPTRVLPFGLSTTRTSCRATACPPAHRTNTRSYVPTKPTPGIQVNAPVDAFSAEPIGSGASPPATRRYPVTVPSTLRARSFDAFQLQLDAIELLGLHRRASVADRVRLQRRLEIEAAASVNRRDGARRRVHGRRQRRRRVDPERRRARHRQRRRAADHRRPGARHRALRRIEDQAAVRHREVAAPDPGRGPQVVGHEPRDRVDAVGERRAVEDRPRRARSRSPGTAPPGRAPSDPRGSSSPTGRR